MKASKKAKISATKSPFEIIPEIPEIAFDNITVEKSVADITDEDIADALQEITSRNRDYEPNPSKDIAEDGDMLNINFEGFVDGEAFAGGKGEDYRLKLGSNSFIPGFEPQLVGAKKGVECDVNVTFPESYHSDELAGKDALFKVTVNDILQEVDATVDDAFAQRFGLENLDALKDAMRKQLETGADAASRSRLKKALFDKLEGKRHIPDSSKHEGHGI